jgi:hypothetical protein
MLGNHGGEMGHITTVCSECGDPFSYEVSEEILHEDYDGDWDRMMNEHKFICGECQ